MSLPRRFLNLIVDNFEPGARSLSCIDLKRLQLFNPTTPQTAAHGHRSTSKSELPQDATAAVIPKKTTSQTLAAVSQKKNVQEVVAAALGMELIRLRTPRYTPTSLTGGGGGGGSITWTFEACSMHGVDQHWSIGCFPFADCKVLCMDQCGRAILFDADTRQVKTMPTLHYKLPALHYKFMNTPLSLFVPSADGDGGNLFLMRNPPLPQPRCSIGQPCDDFEVLVYCNCKDGPTCYSQLLPPPPYVHDPSYLNGAFKFKISSYAVVDGSICISVNSLGTYCLDTASHTWSKVGEWMLPFYGKVEYVPELKLWFGLSADTLHLAAADLSTMDAQPQLVAAWKELNPQEGWEECADDAQLVYLGSAGRFCVARHLKLVDLGSELFGQRISVFTGVEVVPRFHYDSGNADSTGTGKVKLEMICHKSGCHVPVDDTIIKDMF